MAELDLGREPTLRDRPFPGGRVVRLWEGQRNATGTALEVSEVALDETITPARLRQAWEARRGQTVRPVIVAAMVGERWLVCGPQGTPPPTVDLTTELANRILSGLLDEPPVAAALRALTLFARTQGSGNVPGFRNRNLVSTHYVTTVLRRERRPEWTDAAEFGTGALGRAGEPLLRALGYELRPLGPREYQLRDDDLTVAVVHVYDDGASLDRVAEGRTAPPSTIALARARDLGVDHALLVAGTLIRIYSLRAEEALDEGAASAAYVEFDTALLPAEFAPLLGALVSPDALRPGGRLERIRAESGRYAVGLRERFTKRLYEEVVDRLVRGIWEAARTSGCTPLPTENELYRATLVLLFRLLFLLYAEDRNLLPMQQAEYAANSITRLVQRVAEIHAAPGRRFDERATSNWTDLRQLFEAVRSGNADWGVPPYDGGLFEEDGLDGGLLARIALPNAVIGPALVALGWDSGEDGSGKIDFGDVGVRQIGTIYEGLLSYEVAFAATDLRVELGAEGEPYVEAVSGEQVDVPRGAPHVRSPQGGRKATGSYYTPTFAVDRLVDKAVRPALRLHLDGLPHDPEIATTRLLDFRVCDPAMGSGHFLVAALDVITDEVGRYLAAHENRPLAAELRRARERLAVVGSEYGAPDLAERASDVDLLRRLVLKRCIYGVDLNPMAVELARLGLWLHALVPGLPLSYLGHTLRHGNSLLGIGPDLPAEVGLFALGAETDARQKADQVASLTDLELGEVERSRELEAEMRSKTSSLRDLYDVLTAEKLLGSDMAELQVRAADIVSGTTDIFLVNQLERARRAVSEQVGFHWRIEFPEVFVRERPGFDAVLGNPPWEEVTVERLGFFTRYIPGLKSLRSHSEQERKIAELIARYETPRERYEAEAVEKEALRRYLQATYSLTRSGDPDLYKAFAERFLQIVRAGARLGVVLPRSAFAGDGTTPFREELFGRAVGLDLDFVLNNRSWMFPDVHPQYTIGLVHGQIGGERERSISVAGPAGGRSAFDHLDDDRVEWTLDELRSALPDLAIPLIPSVRLARLFKRLATTHPRLDSAKSGWRVLPWAELHATKDRQSGLMREPDVAPTDSWPVYGGKSFDLWEPELWKKGGELPFRLHPDDGLPVLQQKRLRSDVWRAFPRSIVLDPATLPQHGPRILFRDVTNRTNSRTVITALVPPHVFAVNTAPSLVWPSGNESDVAYLLGVLGSVSFDWLARRRVEIHLNYYILNSLPVPRPARSDPRWRRVVELAGRLAAIDERYAAFANEVGVDVGPLASGTKAAFIAELDAVVAHLFGLERDELEAMFEDFPATDAGLSPGRRAAILTRFDEWAS